MSPIRYRTADVDGFNVFYREAGSANAPKLLLLHGFPTASHMFRDLIPLLADRFHIVAPDLPGFGQSDLPPRENFNYTFDNIANVMDRLTEVIMLSRLFRRLFLQALAAAHKQLQFFGNHARCRRPARSCARADDASSPSPRCAARR
jgi:alpha-beta hydrolase superfamily lysophospholipase